MYIQSEQFPVSHAAGCSDSPGFIDFVEGPCIIKEYNCTMGCLMWTGCDRNVNYQGSSLTMCVTVDSQSHVCLQSLQISSSSGVQTCPLCTHLCGVVAHLSHTCCVAGCCESFVLSDMGAQCQRVEEPECPVQDNDTFPHHNILWTLYSHYVPADLQDKRCI